MCPLSIFNQLQAMTHTLFKMISGGITLTLLVLVGACGKTGPLYLEKPVKDPQQANTAAQTNQDKDRQNQK